MPPVLRSATKAQSAKVIGTNEPNRSVGQQDTVVDRGKQDIPSHEPSNTTSNDRAPTSKFNEDASTHDMDADSSHKVSKIPLAALERMTLSANNRINLKKAAQAKYVRRWSSLLEMMFDTPEAMKWMASFRIDVLNKLDTGDDKESSRGESDKDGSKTPEERKKRRQMVITRYLKKWNAMLGQGFDYPMCDELYQEFEDWMKGMEGVFDELTN
ncbi:hypothetical protein C0993_010353 [Termitomyces sp. T159_Od127]|nr:hypothetical protein C0993_010353 [Termitomyces sp. T159_Od127]